VSSETSRQIAHLDMDAFYAAVELLRYPELAGLPVVIGGGSRYQPEETTDPATGRVVRRFMRLRDYAGRGVATTATYEARALGVHSAMGLMKAARLAPDAVLLPTDFDRYRVYSRRFKAAVRSIAPQVEASGIDEIYIDLTGVKLPEHDAAAEGAAETRGAPDVAKAIKESVRTRPVCLADQSRQTNCRQDCVRVDKLDGLTMLSEDDIPRRVRPPPVRKLVGIGPKTTGGCNLGVRTIGSGAYAEPAWLIEHFGRAAVRGCTTPRRVDDRPVVTESEPVTISRETTFERDCTPDATATSVQNL
jgi:DNA polymerase-4